MNERTAAAGIVCPRCDNENPIGKEFCRNCGIALMEQCPDCLRPTTIAERFCGHCGTNLEEVRQKEVRAIRTRLEMLDTLEAERKYSDAILIAKSLVRTDGDRFPDELQRAKQRLQELTAARERADAEAAALAETGKAYLAAADYLKAAARFGEIHPNLRTPEVVEQLAEAVEKAKRVQSLRDEIQAGIASNAPLSVFGKIAQLLTLVRSDAKLEQLGRQIRERVVAAAKAKEQAGALAEASRLLAQVPDRFRDETVRASEAELDEVLWIERDLKETPFVDPPLVGLAERLVKLAPKLPRAAQWLQEAKKRWKEGEAKGIEMPWVANASPRFGGSLGWIDPRIADSPAIADVPGGRLALQRFSIAIGLGLQAIGAAEVVETLAPPKASKGLLSKLSLFGKKKEAKVGWGLDLGSSALKAAKFVEQDGVVRIESLRIIEFRKEATVAKSDSELREAIRGALVKLKDETDIGDSPCLVSIDPKGSLTRFIGLPGGNDAKFEQMVELEAKHLIPYSLDQVHWYWHRFETQSNGQRTVMLVASRKNEVDDLVELLKQHELNVIGFQCEPVALLNLVRYRAKQDATSKPIVAVELGSTHAHVVATAGNQTWMRTISHGGSRITAAIAKGRMVTFAQAEEQKLAPHRADSPCGLFRDAATSVNELVSEIDRSLRAANAAGIATETAQVLLSGGGSRMHGLPRALYHGAEALLAAGARTSDGSAKSSESRGIE
ncbi:MAG TPA: hypothetical protein DCQ98_00230 [Planctomycetaceae bacterium]|nr:hypothetical protein [Planctomycetaceae bacterium]HRE99672.1 pilus assembly protein PilM [Pirellulaceae bacterium]